MEQTPNTSVMPLRIALILLPTPQFDINTVDQSVLASYQTVQPELNALLNSAPSPEMLSITISDDSDANSFESQLNAATNAINNGYIVKLATATHALLMLPALKAAQMRIHPHAQLAAMQQAESTPISQDGIPSNALSQSLIQAKRSLTDVSVNECFENLNSEQQFTEVYSLIQQLASRTHVRKAVHQGVKLGAKQAKSHYWFSEFHQNRVAAINFVNGQQATSYVLTQGTGSLAPKSMLSSQRLMFILPGNSEQDIAASIAKLIQQLASLQVADTNELSLQHQQVLLSTMHDNFVNAARLFSSHNKPAYQAVIQASSFVAAKQELNALNDALAALFAEQTNANLSHSSLSQYKTPAGSYLTLTPLGNSDNDAQAGLAFVYPGVGTVYADMLNELHQYFPALYAKLEREGDLKSMLQAEDIYHLDPKHAAKMSLGDLAIAGVGSSYLLTQLLTNEFNIKPNFALGYSMGEASMWASLGVWQNPHALISKTQTDPLFTSAISGKLTAVRQAWQLDDTAAEIQWNSFVVRSEAAPLEALLKDYPHAYLAIIQGDTCVIAGCETQCKALLAALGKRGIAANRVTAMHTQPAMQEHQNVMDFYLQPLKAELPSEIGFISAADLTAKQTVSEQALSSLVVAQSIADTFCQTLDFTALVHHAQHQGAKLFVEIGADRQNCTLIDKIAKQDSASSAKHQPCCTVPMNAKGSQDITSVIKAIGQLISHNVPLSLQPFIDGLKRELAHCQLIAHSAAKQSTAIESNQDHLLQGEV
ncbi:MULTISPECIES: PfaB family protein [unclassified Shewanella]|uniref:PfaB family protein n=1 Tax=unclassified Shewanella TaxID=196818 RepID=UPI001BC6A6D6|nr:MULTISPECIES: PfaB family protein [unclassified Shewanella]GIU16644.1 omega-3 polyunsaturated fatty acid synthase PfaB [Shewanella sp. MBTL60-112-B1]GIU35763.1 omega-3 polyunsaturated fatty acid synthase PfaB [Shewanella sp. MBTL60-112-B2]